MQSQFFLTFYAISGHQKLNTIGEKNSDCEEKCRKSCTVNSFCYQSKSHNLTEGWKCKCGGVNSSIKNCNSECQIKCESKEARCDSHKNCNCATRRNFLTYCDNFCKKGCKNPFAKCSSDKVCFCDNH